MSPLFQLLLLIQTSLVLYLYECTMPYQSSLPCNGCGTMDVKTKGMGLVVN